MKITKLLKLVLPGALLLTASACNEPVEDSGERGASAHRAAAAAAVAGSCATDVPAACGGQSSDGCWCDDLCDQYGDCCEDKVDVCDTVFCESPDDCAADEYCHYAKDDDCGITGSGECTPLPTSCGPDDSTFNICGCDGELYESECAANLEGESRDPDGTCFADGSCKERCGESSGSCYCDDLCEQYGDCCDDYAFECVDPAPPATCEGNCGGQTEAGCWCDDECADFGDCCADQAEFCGPVACTKDAMICPDGTVLGREGPDCEFPACPCDDGDDCNPGESCNPLTNLCEGAPGCELILCGPGQACIEDEFGAGSCQPVEPIGCELIDCNIGFDCVEDETGAGDCVPGNCGPFPPCGPGYECVAQDGFVWAACQPIDGEGECESDNDCGLGEQCNMCPSICGPDAEVCPAVCGDPVCEPVPGPGCAAALCPVGTTCVEDNNGNVECVPNAGSCTNDDDCDQGTVCDTCPPINCPPGMLCPQVCPEPECVTPEYNDQCAVISCIVGTVCGEHPVTGEVGCY